MVSNFLIYAVIIALLNGHALAQRRPARPGATRPRAGAGRGAGAAGRGAGTAGRGTGAAGRATPAPEKEKPQAVDAAGVTIPDPVDSAFHICRKFGADGTVTEKKYDQCTSFCCGGEVVRKAEGVTCCGSEEFGTPFKEGDLSCCEWWTGVGKAYRTEMVKNHRYGCCGAHLIHHGLQGCCYGDGPPEPYVRGKETCCGSNKVKLTSFYGGATCCGSTAAYDRRRQSCPCGDGQVVDARADQTGCCQGNLGREAPYIIKTQFCCNGMVGTKGKDFCCGSEVGKIGTDVCCDGGIVVPVVPPDPAKTACCNTVPYNPKRQMCCEGEVKPFTGTNSECCGLVPYDPKRQICCEGQIWTKRTDGSSCCGEFAFFPEKQSFCHQGVVYFTAAVRGDAGCGDKFYNSKDGKSLCCNDKLIRVNNKDSCCDDVAYNSKTEICCMGNVFDKADGDICCHNVPYFKGNTTICCDLGPSGYFHRPTCCGGNGYDAALGGVCCAGNIFEGFIWPSCCVDQGYDAATHTCCGATIYKNPRNSFQTSCCGEIDPRPYDLITQMCCEGSAVAIPAGMNRRQATCCGHKSVYDPGTHLCCDTVTVKMDNIYFSKCCGRETYDSRTQICCDGKDGTKPAIAAKSKFGATTSCCGNVVFDTKKQYCCEGVLTKAAKGVSECCAGVPYDRTKNICCDGKLQKIGKNVPWAKASCCGNSCMYEGPQYCCENRIYLGNARSKKTCDVY